MDRFLALTAEPLKEMYVQFLNFSPKLLAMFIIILGGFFAARMVRAMLIRLLKAIKFDVWSDRMGLTSMLRSADLWSKPSGAVSSFVFWLLLVVALLAGLTALNVPVIDGMVSQIVTYLPRVVSAVLILVLGYIASGLIGTAVLISLVNSGYHFAKQLARAVRLLLIVLIVAMALEQLQVAPGIVVAAFSIVFGGIVLALSVSFGIAGVDTAKRIIEQREERKEERRRDIQHV